MAKILITGTAGFIGFHLVNRLAREGHQLVGFDNINDYYDVQLKYARLAQTGIPQESIDAGVMIQSRTMPGYRFVKASLEDKATLMHLFEREQGFDYVVHLAAQAGVRYSLEHPDSYIQSNIVGFLNILEACRHFPVKHLVYASSSSVYGDNACVPFSETNRVDTPVSLYAATKKSNELMAHSYSHLYGIPTTGLRFFTVYGPWGRPDMSPILFATAIVKGDPIKVFNNGEMERDFTYVDDIVEGTARVTFLPPAAGSVAAAPRSGFDAPAAGSVAPEGAFIPPEGAFVPPAAGSIPPAAGSLSACRQTFDVLGSGESDPPLSSPSALATSAPYRILNIGHGSPSKLMYFIELMEKHMGKKAQKIMMPMQPGDVRQTWADTTALEDITGYKPHITLDQGVQQFTEWFKKYY